MKKLIYLLGFIIAFTLLLSNPLFAQTADMETPAFETICDADRGAAFGLCTAYCEAMDCESAVPQASQIACDRVRNKYENVTGHKPPCLPNVCPCLSGLEKDTDWFTSATTSESCFANTLGPAYIEIRGTTNLDPLFLLYDIQTSGFIDSCSYRTREGFTGQRGVLPEQFDDCVALFADPFAAAACFP